MPTLFGLGTQLRAPDAAAPPALGLLYACYAVVIVQWRLVVWFEWGEREYLSNLRRLLVVAGWVF